MTGNPPQSSTSPILLVTLNARYQHSALGLRYLWANMGELQPRTRIREFTIGQAPELILESLLNEEPVIIGFGVYIWNVQQTLELLLLLHSLRPDIYRVIGGPEARFMDDHSALGTQTHYLIPGPADLAFAALCRCILAGHPPASMVFQPTPFRLEQLQLPYDAYTATDIAKRVIYLETSRGCPFHCTFCLSALDVGLKLFPLPQILEALEQLLQRGVRRFKFVDRTFNLKLGHAIPILEWFLRHLDAGLFLHFEMIPDRLPEALRAVIRRFPAGVLQLEIGVQSLDPQVLKAIDREQRAGVTLNHLRWLRELDSVHLHVDMLYGLPGQNLASLAHDFDQLVAINPQEIQLGALKRLAGTPLALDPAQSALQFHPHPPYRILRTPDLDFLTIQRLHRFARYWDLIANSGRFQRCLPLLLGQAPFQHFLKLTDWLYAQTGQTHQIALEKLFAWLEAWNRAELHHQDLPMALRLDAERCGIKEKAIPWRHPFSHASTPEFSHSLPERQRRHIPTETIP